MFKASPEGTRETSTNYLNMPYLGSATVKDIKLEEINNTENCFVVYLETHGEDIKGNSVNGFIHNRTEWAPDENTDQEKVKKAIDRIAYFVAKFAPEEEVLAVEGTNWRDYCSKMIQLLNKYNAIGTEANIKVIGNVYNGKASVQTPKYPGWIYTDGSMPAFSKSELAANREYLAALSATPTSTDEQSVDMDLIDEAGF